jgi:ankyrin repeat protein
MSTLLASGANPLELNHDEMSAHEIAIAHQQTDAAELIGEASVRFALETEDLQAAMKHIQLGASSNTYLSNGWTSLMLFSLHGWFDGVKEVVDLGADVNVSENDGWTPLMFACAKGELSIVELLLSIGADFHHKSHDGRSAIDIAIAHEHTEVIERLRAAGAVESPPEEDHPIPVEGEQEQAESN